MERTARLVRLALAALPPPRAPWIFNLGGLEGSNNTVGGAGGGSGGEAAHSVGGTAACTVEVKGTHASGTPPGCAAGDGHEGDGIGSLAGGRNSAIPSLGKQVQKYNPYPDLLCCSVPSGLWKSTWETSPLVLHDHYLVLAKQSAGQEDEGLYANAAIRNAAICEAQSVDVSNKITSILKGHPGPICSFRVDSSDWTNESTLIEWLDLLSTKSVQELIIVNLGHGIGTRFPIQELHSTHLHTLQIGFLTIADLDLHSFDYSALRVLRLIDCTFEGLKLQWIITDCQSLEELTIAFSTENLKINSQSLKKMHNVCNSATRFIIESAPKLTELLTDITPREEKERIKPVRSAVTVAVSLNDVPLLKCIKSLYLCYQSVTINNVFITKDKIAWTSLKELSIGLDMSNRTQRDNLRKILDSVPLLTDLSIRRMDSVARDEGFDVTLDCPFEDLDTAVCIAKNLRRFEMNDFRGGAAECCMIKYVLKFSSEWNIKEMFVGSGLEFAQRFEWFNTSITDDDLAKLSLGMKWKMDWVVLNPKAMGAIPAALS
ncbi:hypothetical protein U9M48_005282 [Paspalum notatum var. saurae]|uniref:F-box/LRR-repeat protein 15/At3g58940/PEG3-like LRR domain-containing protein n=1 Tax=Paspalum notatum var. saurae TaxID=547442 RepID=A0AAQ3SLC5_PASNO